MFTIPFALFIILFALFAAMLYAALTLRPLHQQMPEGEPLAIIPIAREATILDQAYRLDSSTLTWHIDEARKLGFYKQARTMQDALVAVMLRERIEREMQAQLAERQAVRPVVRLHVSTLGGTA